MNTSLTKCRRIAGLALWSLCVAARVDGQTALSASDAINSRIVHGIGEPSDHSRVSFEGNSDGVSVIKEVRVKPGDTVKKDDVLMTEDSEQAQAELAVMQAAAEATGAAEEAQVTIDSQNKLIEKYNELSNANRPGIELINAVRDRDVATARKKQAEEEKKQRQLAVQRQRVKVQHMTLRSPIAGFVESVSLYAGEVVDANSAKEGACFVIKTDPLWVEIHLSAFQASKLALHDKVEVAFPDAPDQWRGGEVIFLDPSVEYVGQTRTVRVSLPNPENHPSGLPMIVRLPEKAAVSEAQAVGLAR